MLDRLLVSKPLNRTNVAYNEVLEVKQNIPAMLGINVGATLNINYTPQ
jgi:uncharacterized membrane protein (UPF0127 family)